MTRSKVYLDGRDLERESEALMQFRLTYEGSLLATNPHDYCKRMEHKHALRIEFHKQLRELWATNPFLNSHMMDRASKPLLPGCRDDVWGPEPEAQRRMVDVLGDVYARHDYRFVPLVRKEISLWCSLRILLLRRDSQWSVTSAGDIDNRVKTLIDALTMPKSEQGPPMKDGKVVPPGDGENPFFVLLDDDRQVTHLEVEADSALARNPDNADDNSYVRATINVGIRPYNVGTFNLSFA